MTTPWHMARVASRRELPKPRKMMGPVGERDPNLAYGRIGFDVPGGSYTSSGGQLEMGVCRECGFHVCSCDPYAHFKASMAAFPGAQPAIMRYLRKGSGAFINGKLCFSAQDVPPDVLATLKVEA